MTITMTSKNQITIPKKVTNALGLKSGAMFEVGFSKDAIELILLEIKERHFTDKEYAKLEALAAKESGKEKRVTRKFISNLKKENLN
ncbi:MAG: AbrB/MazE/SpoVT family DNA-binding domain-containing protein [Candidatus Omnitrophota bacterium]|nr:AbrB/MazE/SpoVT family DNA-binding domain-containing protein [Candidatus Omnitrophota bacterium]